MIPQQSKMNTKFIVKNGTQVPKVQWKRGTDHDRHHGHLRNEGFKK